MWVLPIAAGFWGTLLMALLIVRSSRWHSHLSADSSFGVQKIHEGTVPRIGGLAVAAGLLAGWSTAWVMRLVPDVTHPALVLLAGSLAFGFGLAEDITKTIAVRSRLLATTGSGLAAALMTGIAMQDTGVPLIDWALSWFPLAALFTAFAVGGVSNAINIIDGLNGLASGSVAIMSLGLAGVAWQVGDGFSAHMALMLAAVSLGFFVVNWPKGPLFLGDGGAYLLGFCLAWLAVLIPMRNQAVDAWTTLMVLAYPVLEVASSVLRRRRRSGHHPGQPDKVHMHHLVYRRLVCLRWPQLNRKLKNGLAGFISLSWSVLCALWANIFPTNALWQALGLVALVLAYRAVYNRLSLR